MGGIANGIAYHGGFIPYVRDVPDVQRLHARLASGWRRCRGLHVIYVWTHDSVGLGEDGPTHQPVEHYAALRAIPNLCVRPARRRQRDRGGLGARGRAARRPGRAGADPPEAADPARARIDLAREGVARGGYVLREAAGGAPQLIMIGTGSELQLAFAAAEALEARGHPDPRRVAPLLGAVRGPGRRPTATTVLPPAVRKRVSVEIGVSLGWERWVGDEGAIIGLDHFGASAPAAHDLRALRLHRRARHRRRPAGRPRRPARPDPDRSTAATSGTWIRPQLGDVVEPARHRDPARSQVCLQRSPITHRRSVRLRPGRCPR